MNFYEFLLSFFIIVGRPVIIHTHYLWKRVLYLQLRNLFFLLTFSRFHRCVHVFIRKEKSLSDLGALHIFFFFTQKNMAKKIRFYLIIKSVKFMHRWPIKKNFVVSGKERGKKRTWRTGWRIGDDRSFVYGFFKKSFESRLLILPNMSQVTRFGPRNAGKRLTDFTALLPIIVPL